MRERRSEYWTNRTSLEAGTPFRQELRYWLNGVCIDHGIKQSRQRDDNIVLKCASKSERTVANSTMCQDLAAQGHETWCGRLQFALPEDLPDHRPSENWGTVENLDRSEKIGFLFLNHVKISTIQRRRTMMVTPSRSNALTQVLQSLRLCPEKSEDVQLQKKIVQLQIMTYVAKWKILPQQIRQCLNK